MKLKQTVLTMVAAFMLSAASLVAIAQPVFAAKCAGVDTAILRCEDEEEGDIQTNGVWQLLLLVLNIMTALIGIVAVGGIVYGSILYASAQDNDAQVKKAKETIANVVIGIVGFALMFSFLQFIIPGGVFNQI